MVSRENRELPKEIWRRFFDTVSSEIRGKGVDITLTSEGSDIHMGTSWQAHGLIYDPHDDALIISCERIEHVIQSPRSIRVERLGPSVCSIEVMKDAGEREMVHFVDPVLLPAA